MQNLYLQVSDLAECSDQKLNKYMAGIGHSWPKSCDHISKSLYTNYMFDWIAPDLVFHAVLREIWKPSTLLFVYICKYNNICVYIYKNKNYVQTMYIMYICIYICICIYIYILSIYNIQICRYNYIYIYTHREIEQIFNCVCSSDLWLLDSRDPKRFPATSDHVDWVNVTSKLICFL